MLPLKKVAPPMTHLNLTMGAFIQNGVAPANDNSPENEETLNYWAAGIALGLGIVFFLLFK